MAMPDDIREHRANAIACLAEGTCRKVPEKFQGRQDVKCLLSWRAAKGELDRKMFEDRVVFDPVGDRLLVAIPEGLMSAEDCTMARNMYLHKSYAANNQRYMDVLRCKPLKKWLRGDDSFKSWSVLTADKLTLMVDSAMGSATFGNKCLCGLGEADAERIVTNGYVCSYPIRRTIGNLLFRSPHTGERITRQDLRSMFRGHVAKMLRCGGRTTAISDLWEVFEQKEIRETRPPH